MARPAGEGRCRSCGALILWCKLMPAGRPHPLDAIPVCGGNIETKPGVLSGERYGRVVPADEREERKLYVSHFATCPQSSSWRS